MKLIKKAMIFSAFVFIVIPGYASSALENAGEISPSAVPLKILSLKEHAIVEKKIREAKKTGKETVEVVSKFEDEKQEKDLSHLPENVREAAENSKQGILLTGFHTEREGERIIYEIEGIAESKCYEIEITVKGEVLEIEQCD